MKGVEVGFHDFVLQDDGNHVASTCLKIMVAANGKIHTVMLCVDSIPPWNVDAADPWKLALPVMWKNTMECANVDTISFSCFSTFVAPSRVGDPAVVMSGVRVGVEKMTVPCNIGR